jgi:hypothetical protein
LARRLLRIGAIGMAALSPSTAFADAAALSCTQAAASAEISLATPPGLLLAIANVESGRTDATGARTPWPWTVQAGGIGRFFATVEQAVLAVRALHASGVQSIDIGCFQVNLFHHPNAFPDLASGFDPLPNALAAARFLASLHEELGAWEPAIAAYHSRQPVLGAPYRDQVLASWRGARLFAGPGFRLAHVWGPTGELGLGAGGLSLTPQTIHFETMSAGGSSRWPRVITGTAR